MLDTGYFTINRQIINNWIYPTNQDRKFTEFEAWIWIIQNANYFCQKKLIQGKLAVVPRGCFDCTVMQLSKTWKWNKRTVEKFLQNLTDEDMIERLKINPKNKKSCTLVKVNKYNDFQIEIFNKCTTKCTIQCTAESTLECTTKCTLECTPYKNIKNIKNITTTILPENNLPNISEGISDAQAFIEEAKNWRGEFSNVHLTEKQYSKLLGIIGNKEKLDELINKLSEKIGANNPKESEYVETKPEMHFIRIRQYFKYYKENPNLWPSGKGQKNQSRTAPKNSGEQSIYELAKSMANKGQEE